MIDLRSDTVTKPSAGMRAAMSAADVGDDVYGEDPTVRALEERVAARLGKQAALFVPSGTMANQIALLCHCRAADEVYVGQGTHVMIYESGAAAAWSGVQFREVGQGGLFSAAELEAAIGPREMHAPWPRLVVVENTHNRAGGRVFALEGIGAIAAAARAKDLALHLDGARLWNAHVATGVALDAYAAPFDTVSVCFSKGLGAPVGSMLAGTAELVARARRFRKMLGGGMRQAGILAAAALYALEHNVARLADDHAHARRFAERLGRVGPVRADVASVETNIVLVDVDRAAADVVAAAASQGVLVNAVAPRRLRVVTHMDVSAADLDRAADVLSACG